MKRHSALLIRIANSLAIGLCVAWFVFDPGFEPVVTGLLLAVGFLVPINQQSNDSAPAIDTRINVLTPTLINPSSSPILGQDATRRAIELKRGDLLVLKGDMGIAVIELQHLVGGKAKYRWRYVAEVRGTEISGNGEVFEQYARAHRDSNHVTDVGGELYIKAGPYQIEWSQGSKEIGYVYPRGKDYSAYVVPSTPLSKFRL